MLDVDMEDLVSLRMLRFLIKTADDNGYSLEVLKAVEKVNERPKRSIVQEAG